MRPKTFALLLLATLCLTPGLAHAQRPTIEARITFLDPFDSNLNAPAGLQSDYLDGGRGSHTYVSEYSQAGKKTTPEVRAWINDNGDAVLQLPGTWRHLRMNLSPPGLTPPCAPYAWIFNPLPPPTGWFPTQQVFWVENILTVLEGQVQQPRGAGIGNISGYGRVRLKDGEFCTGSVWVTCTGPDTWEVLSPPTNSPSAGSPGLAALLQNLATKPGQATIRPVQFMNFQFHIKVERLP